MTQSKSGTPKTLVALNKFIQHEIKSTLLVVKGKGYFYIASDDKETALDIAKLPQTSIYVYRVSDMTFENWYLSITMLLSKAPATPTNYSDEKSTSLRVVNIDLHEAKSSIDNICVLGAMTKDAQSKKVLAKLDAYLQDVWHKVLEANRKQAPTPTSKEIRIIILTKK